MKVNGKQFEGLWRDAAHPGIVHVIDQRYLPFEFVIRDLKTFHDARKAIMEMWIRGAPLIGVTAAFGMYLATNELKEKANLYAQLKEKAEYMKSARPTAVNLSYGINYVLESVKNENSLQDIRGKALDAAEKIRKEEIHRCYEIGIHGLPIIKELFEKKGKQPINILTHCNAGWLACVDYGTALAPVYLAHEKGIPMNVYVDETRPRNQGARLTAWELAVKGISHTVIPDNTGGLLMQKGMVDMVIVGSDRVSINGDVANKIGTYLKALAAHENHVPFHVALPTTTIDMQIENAMEQIEIEQRNEDEVRFIQGWDGHLQNKYQIIPNESPVLNYGFDITPAGYISRLVTEKGVCRPDKTEIRKLIDG